MPSKFKRRGKGKIPPSRIARDLGQRFFPLTKVERDERRCLFTDVGWAHIRPHRGCPLDRWPAIVLNGPSGTPWSNPQHDVAGDLASAGSWVFPKPEGEADDDGSSDR